MKAFLREARRRKVFRMAALYIVAAWAMIQVAGEASEAFGVSAAALRSLWLVLLLCFPLALVFGWYYDITPRGIVRTPPAGPTDDGNLALTRSDYLILAALLAVVSMIAYPLVGNFVGSRIEEQVTAGPTESLPHSIAVLPFVNMSADSENEYFCDGISEELLNKLAQLSGLKVAARTSSFHFRGKNAPVQEIAAQLGVTTILEGSVRRIGNKIRVTAQLIDAADGYHLWSANFDRELGDIFVIQDEIAEQVVGSLQVTLLGDDATRLSRHPTDNVEAYNAYLLGRHRIGQRTSASLQEAVTYFDKAVDLDPEFALAYVGLADAYNLLGWWGTLSSEEVVARVEPALERALALDDRSGEAQATLGLLLWRKQDVGAADAAFRRAIALNPSYVDAYERYGQMLRWFGRREEALVLHRKALELDPLSTSLNMTLAEDYHELGRFEEALRQCQRVVEIDPDFPRAYTLMADLYWEVFGDVAAGARWLQKAAELDPGNPNHARWLAMIYLDLGDADTARSWLDIAVAAAPDQAQTRLTQLLYAHYSGGEADVMAAARALLLLVPDNSWGLAVLRDADLDAGRSDLAVRRYQQAYPDLFANSVAGGEGFDYGHAIDASLALIEAGDDHRAQMLLDASLASLETRPRLGYAGFGISDVEVYALRGDKSAALSALREAIDTGWRSFWWMSLKRNRNLASLHNDPTYRGMVRELEAEMRDQRARL